MHPHNTCSPCDILYCKDGYVFEVKSSTSHCDHAHIEMYHTVLVHFKCHLSDSSKCYLRPLDHIRKGAFDFNIIHCIMVACIHYIVYNSKCLTI